MKLSSTRAALAAVLIVSAPLAGCGYNTLPTQEERARAAMADLQAAYQRRADLVGNLVATVRGAAVQERTVLVEVTEARARATGINLSPETLSDPAALARFQSSQSALSQSLGRLLVVTENYPQLQTNQNFMALQVQLEGTENRINNQRRDYNEAARVYNTSLRTFPTVIWAKTFQSGQRPMALFEAAPGSEAAPTVNFGAAMA